MIVKEMRLQLSRLMKPPTIAAAEEVTRTTTMTTPVTTITTTTTTIWTVDAPLQTRALDHNQCPITICHQEINVNILRWKEALNVGVNVCAILTMLKLPVQTQQHPIAKEDTVTAADKASYKIYMRATCSGSSTSSGQSISAIMEEVPYQQQESEQTTHQSHNRGGLVLV